MKSENRSITSRRVHAAVEAFGLNLSGSGVLTEAASGPYIATSLLAALAGADRVVACVRDSRWGTADDVKRETYALADELGVKKRIEVTTRPPLEVADDLNIVTNLGFVRPISEQVIERLAPHAAISLMWEPWELRASDLDFEACNRLSIPVIATDECHPQVNTFAAVGLLGLKLLLEVGCEVSGLNIAVIGSDPFGESCRSILEAAGAKVTQLIPSPSWLNTSTETFLSAADAIVLAEHRYHEEIIGRTTPRIVESLSKQGTPIVHICGSVDEDYLAAAGLIKYPLGTVPSGHMLITTAHLGPKPVIDLHAAGLLVAGIVSRERKRGRSVEESVAVAVDSGYGLAVPVRT